MIVETRADGKTVLKDIVCKFKDIGLIPTNDMRKIELGQIVGGNTYTVCPIHIYFKSFMFSSKDEIK